MVLDEGALELEGRDPVVGRLEDVVRSTDEGEVPLLVERRDVLLCLRLEGVLVAEAADGIGAVAAGLAAWLAGELHRWVRGRHDRRLPLLLSAIALVIAGLGLYPALRRRQWLYLLLLAFFPLALKVKRFAPFPLLLLLPFLHRYAQEAIERLTSGQRWRQLGLVASLLALREFVSLTPTRRGDHKALLLAFFGVLPAQYLLMGTGHTDLFTVFVPVYVFLLVPLVSGLGDDPHRFLERNATVQWGIMVCVYGLSHVPALLFLRVPGTQGSSVFLVFWLVMVVQTAMVVQHVAGRSLRRPPSLPNISEAFRWPAWMVGVLAGGLVGGLLAGLTPFKPGQGLAMGLIASASGGLGHLVMKAIKRDRGVPHWGALGRSVTGAVGLLDRVDALCFAAPVLYQSIHWYFHP